jgi:hypothetical protein
MSGIERVFSYGYTGVSLGGLLAAERCGIKTCGHVPFGFMTDKGPQPILGNRFGLVEYNGAWAAKNIDDSDATILMSDDVESSKAREVSDYCRSNGKPCVTLGVLNGDTDACLLFLFLIRPSSVNVVGDVDGSFNVITKAARELLVYVFNAYGASHC